MKAELKKRRRATITAKRRAKRIRKGLRLALEKDRKAL